MQKNVASQKLFRRRGEGVGNSPAAFAKAVSESLFLDSRDLAPVSQTKGSSIKRNHFDVASLTALKCQQAARTHSCPSYLTGLSSNESGRQLGFGSGRPRMGRGAFFGCGDFAFGFFGHRPTLAALPVFARSIAGALRWNCSLLGVSHSLPRFRSYFASFVGGAQLSAAFRGVRLSFTTIAEVVKSSACGSQLTDQHNFGSTPFCVIGDSP